MNALQRTVFCAQPTCTVFLFSYLLLVWMVAHFDRNRFFMCETALADRSLNGSIGRLIQRWGSRLIVETGIKPVVPRVSESLLARQTRTDTRHFELDVHARTYVSPGHTKHLTSLLQSTCAFFRLSDDTAWVGGMSVSPNIALSPDHW